MKLSQSSLIREFNIAYLAWCKRRNLDPLDEKLSFDARVNAEMQRAEHKRRRMAKERAQQAAGEESL